MGDTHGEHVEEERKHAWERVCNFMCVYASAPTELVVFIRKKDGAAHGPTWGPAWGTSRRPVRLAMSERLLRTSTPDGAPSEPGEPDPAGMAWRYWRFEDVLQQPLHGNVEWKNLMVRFLRTFQR